MKDSFHTLYYVTALLLITPMCQAEESTHQGINPTTLVNSWKASDETYSKSPITAKLEPDFRVDVPDFDEPGEWYVRRHTDQTYWMMCSGIASPNMMTLRNTLNQNAG